MIILLVRHGLSIGNVDQQNHHIYADHKIPLAEKGHEQAQKAASTIERYIQSLDCPEQKWRIWTSPYLRAKQTAEPISKIKYSDGRAIVSSIREDIALCEQQYGLFDGWTDEELAVKYPDEWATYNKNEKFWARMPQGESRFDVAMRVHQMFGTWHRDEVKNLIVVSHGVTIRAIKMRWLHLSVQWFEAEPNPENCSVEIIKDSNYFGSIRYDD